MKADLHPGALRDIEKAAAFYEREGSAAVGARFVGEFERAAQLVLASPGLGTPRTRGRKAFPTTDLAVSQPVV